jgi:DNA-binding NtrC family response regulator
MTIPQSKILIVDDEESLRTSLTDQLRDEGYEVSAAANSHEAIEILRKSVVHLVILDLKFPEGMTGHELLKYIKSKYSGTKVLVLTAYANLKEGKTAKQEGADDFLSKPYNVEDLIQLVKNMLSI